MGARLAPRDVTEKLGENTANQPPKISIKFSNFSIFPIVQIWSQKSYFGPSGGSKMLPEARSAIPDGFGDFGDFSDFDHF